MLPTTLLDLPCDMMEKILADLGSTWASNGPLSATCSTFCDAFDVTGAALQRVRETGNGDVVLKLYYRRVDDDRIVQALQDYVDNNVIYDDDGEEYVMEFDLSDILLRAIDFDDDLLVRLLMRWPSHTPFQDAFEDAWMFNSAVDGDAETAAYEPDIRVVLLYAAMKGKHHIVELLLHSVEDWTVVNEALTRATTAEVARVLISWPAWPDDKVEEAVLGAFMRGVEMGDKRMVRLALNCPRHAPRADAHDSAALILAAGLGDVAMVRMLLDWPRHAPRADVGNGFALAAAAARGHLDVVRMLLAWRTHAPRADIGNATALMNAAASGHASIVHLLLSWPQHAPRADARESLALLQAVVGGHTDVIDMLLAWPTHTPRIDCMNGMALVEAAGCGNDTVVKALLARWPGPLDPALRRRAMARAAEHSYDGRSLYRVARHLCFPDA